LPGRGVANVGSLGYLSGNSTTKRAEAATAHTGERCRTFKKNPMTNIVKIIEKIVITITILWLAYNTLLTGPPGIVNCELCEDLNDQLRNSYLPYFLIMFILTGILLWYLIRPNKVLRIFSWIIVLITIILTVYVISNETHSFWGIVFKIINDSYQNQ